MPYYLVTKTMQYTEEVYIEASTMKEACDLSGLEEGSRNWDDSWYDSTATEITEEEYKEEVP